MASLVTRRQAADRMRGDQGEGSEFMTLRSGETGGGGVGCGLLLQQAGESALPRNIRLSVPALMKSEL